MIVPPVFGRTYDHPALMTMTNTHNDAATEVQTNFYLSQYYTMVTTKSKKSVLVVVTISVLYFVFAVFGFVAFVAFEDDVAVDVVRVFPFRLLLLLPLPAALDSYVDRCCCGIVYGWDGNRYYCLLLLLLQGFQILRSSA